MQGAVAGDLFRCGAIQAVLDQVAQGIGIGKVLATWRTLGIEEWRSGQAARERVQAAVDVGIHAFFNVVDVLDQGAVTLGDVETDEAIETVLAETEDTAEV